MIKNEKKNKHMTLQERIEIQEYITKSAQNKRAGFKTCSVHNEETRNYNKSSVHNSNPL